MAARITSMILFSSEAVTPVERGSGGSGVSGILPHTN